MGLPQTRRSNCPIAASLDVLGDRWSLLVLRDMVFRGHRYFQEFAASPEGIATNILSERLARLERAGVITKADDPRDRRRHQYTLTEAGLEVIPLLIDLVVWGAALEPVEYPADRVAWMRDDRDGAIRHYRDQVTSATGT